MAGFLQRFYAKVYINVIVENHYADVSMRMEKMGRTLRDKKQRFEIEKGELTKEVTAFIERYERKSPFSYISVLNPVLQQGAHKGCSGENMKDNTWLCVGNKKRPWSIFTDVSTTRSVQKKFKSTGLDFIFSPYSIIASTKEINSDKAQLFVLVLEKSMSVSVFKDGVLEFAKQVSFDEAENEFDMSDESSELLLEDELVLNEEGGMSMDLTIDTESDTEDDMELEDLEGLEDLDELDGLDELDSLDELDELDDLGEEQALDDFQESEELVDMEEDLSTDSDTSLAGFSRNLKRFEMIQNSIHDFYKGADVESAFIEDVYVLDPYDDCADLRGYLEDELFVTVHFKNLNLHEALLVLSKNEVKDAS